MTPDSDGPGTDASRRRFIITASAAGLASLAGCTGGDGNGDGTTADSTSGDTAGTTSGEGTDAPAEGNTESGTESGAEASRLSAEGSSTVYPIANTAASYWNSNAPPDDGEYWGKNSEGSVPGWSNIQTDKNLADYWASLYGFETTGEVSNPPFPVTVGLSHSGTGVTALKNQQVDFGDASAPVEAELPDASEEVLGNFVDHVVGRDGQPIVVSKAIYDAGVTELDADTVRAIYRGEITNWSEVDSYSGDDKEIYAVGRATGSGTDTAFRTNMLGAEDAEMPGVDTRQGQNQQVQTTVAQSDNAIAYMALAFVTDQVPAVALTFDGTTYELGEDPGLGAAEYPLNRDLHMYTWKDTDERESAFLNFIYSEMGQKIFVEGNNYFPLPSSEIEEQRSKLASQSN
ncbi:PstS family phosphate ABC transporter substrate-binding protein [Halomarina salina]|uniref:PstS family phosphate ABC transporter substrate-binding protein n=1 Tax=Halomarina salina TaxID=1872699 RepID=A0ABD5RNP6_9EURY|nr:substrate-binding domain-containing protein [Halomarina salina]